MTRYRDICVEKSILVPTLVANGRVLGQKTRGQSPKRHTTLMTHVEMAVQALTLSDTWIAGTFRLGILCPRLEHRVGTIEHGVSCWAARQSEAPPVRFFAGSESVDNLRETPSARRYDSAVYGLRQLKAIRPDLLPRLARM